MELIIGIILVLIVVILSALPLHLAVSLLGGDSGILKSFFVMILAGIVQAVVSWLVPSLLSFLAFVALIFVYKVMFDLSLFKAFLAWLLQVVFVALLIAILAVVVPTLGIMSLL